MFGNTPFPSTPVYKLVLGFGLCTLGGAMLYAYFKQRDEQDDKRKDRGIKGPKQATIVKPKKSTENDIKISLNISNEHIPLIMGRCGANLVAIQEKTRSVILFRDKDENNICCEISGTPNSVKDARQLLLKEIERAPIVTEEIFIPQSVCGKIVGRCGETLQEICRVSLANLKIDTNSGQKQQNDKRRISITGNRQQVNIARKMLEDIIDEDEELKRAVAEVEQNREPRRSPTNSLNSSLYSSQASLNSANLPPGEKLLAARNDEKPMEVYVSAIASPSKFWVHLIGPQSKRLDDMVQTMTDYYNIEENRELHHIKDPYLGQIVAAIFKYDGKWYRAEIVGILPCVYNNNSVVLDLYFVDYGDSEYVAPHEVFELRTDFLTLRFQAVECFLANLKSTVPNDTETWDPQAVQKFEELTQVANWKKLISRVVSYKDRSKATNDTNGIVREGSPIPGIELYDLTEGVEVNIGHMLISHGFALNLNDNRPISPANAMSSRFISSPDLSTSQNSSSFTPPLTPQSPRPFLNSSADDNTQSPNATLTQERSDEDAFLAQQIQHLQKNCKILPSPSLFNGNHDINELVIKETLLNGNDIIAGNSHAPHSPPSRNIKNSNIESTQDLLASEDNIDNNRNLNGNLVR